MTTAHRPTYNPTRGSNTQGGNKLYVTSQQISSKDLPGNLMLKKRQPGQGTRRDARQIDFKRDLLERENKHNNRGALVSSLYGDSEDFSYSYIEGFNNTDSKLLDITSDLLELEEPKKKQRLESEIGDISEIKSQVTSNNNIADKNENDYVFMQDKDVEFSDDEESIGNKNKNKHKNENKDKDIQSEEEEVVDDEVSEEENSEDELYKEYDKIKRMRDEERRQKEREEADKLKQLTEEQILLGNPLMNNTYSLKKKWFEDTVFKNQSKTEVKVKKRFVNDTVRSDFHRKFIAKTIQ